MARKSKEWPCKVVSGKSSVTVYRWNYKGADRFQLRWIELGEHKNQTLSDEKEAIIIAKQIADRLHAGESAALNLNAEESAIYTHALKIAGKVPLDVALREWSEARRRLGPVPILQAVDDYVSRHRGESVPLFQAVDEFVKSRAGLSGVYTKRLKYRLEHVKTEFGARMLSDITEQEIRAFIDGQGGSPRTRKNMRDAIVTVWRWARRQNYLPRDMQTEAERIEAPEIKRAERIGIFTPDEMRKLLKAAPEHVLPIIAICGFSGVRQQGEIERLQWEDIKFSRNVIDVRGKTGERRFSPLQPNLAAWLKDYKDQTGPVATVGPYRACLRAAEAAGVAWKHNVLRHSFGSYRVATTKSIDQTSLEMGNSPAMVRRHYKELVHENDGKEWFSIMPGDSTS